MCCCFPESYDGVFLALFEVIFEVLDCVTEVFYVSCEWSVDRIETFLPEMLEEDGIEFVVIRQDVHKVRHVVVVATLLP